MFKLLASYAFLTSLAFAGSHQNSLYPYGTNTNQYSSQGSTTFGSNAYTGSNWQTTSSHNGSYGIDSKGNTWNYDKRTGIYQNSSGETRMHGRKTY